VILAGDMTFVENSTKNLIGPFVKAKKQVLLIPGNHESFATADFLAQMYPGTKNIHGYSFQKGNLGIFGAGGGNVINITPDKEIFNALQRGHKNIKDMEKK